MEIKKANHFVFSLNNTFIRFLLLIESWSNRWTVDTVKDWVNQNAVPVLTFLCYLVEIYTVELFEKVTKT